MAVIARAEPICGQEPGTSPGYPMRVQGSKDLGHSQLLSHFMSMELTQKQNNWDRNQHLYGMSVRTGGGLT